MPVFDTNKGDLPWYALPPSSAVLFGSGVSSVQLEGTLYRYVSAGISPGSTTVDSVLAAITIPAASFDGQVITDLFGGVIGSSVSNRGLTLTARGSYGATANSKRLKIFAGVTSAVVGSAVVGGTLIADTGTVSTSGGGWSIGADIYKYGAAGSNTQVAIHQQGVLAPVLLTLNEGSALTFALTGNATTATSDIVANLFVVTGRN